MSLPLDSLVAVVAHRALLADRLPSYLSLLIENGFSLLRQTHLLLADDHIPLLLNAGVDDDVEVFSSSTPACVLLLQRVDAYSTFQSLHDQLDFVYASNNRWSALRDQVTFFPSSHSPIERSLLVIRPGYTQADYAEVLEALDSNGFVTLDLSGKVLTSDEASLLCANNADVPSFTSDVSVFIALERANAQTALTLLLGPTSPSLARAIAPTTLRARVAASLYCSASTEQAAEDSRICWPEGFPLQRVVVVLGGSAIEMEADITIRLLEEGFTVIRRDSLYLSRTRLEKLWRGRLDATRADSILTQWSASHSVCLLLTKVAAVNHSRTLVESLDCRESVYVSTVESLVEDVREVFPLLPPAPTSLSSQEVIDRFNAPLPTPTPTTTPASLQSVLTTALIALCKAKPSADEAVTWLANWLLTHNPNAPSVTGPVVTEAEDGDVTAAPQVTATVWVVGEGLDAVVADLVQGHGFLHVDVGAVLAAAVGNNAEVGLAISEFVSTDRPTPAALVLPLVQKAVSGMQVRPLRVVLTHFPRDLDQAFAYEAAMGEVTAVLVGRDVSGESKVKGGDEGVDAVVQHYREFAKVVEVEIGGEDAKANTAAVQRMLHSIEA